ncbi:unnamed protein product [Rhizophagus irregularis]|nr:unnamed protein product [Rhizophagus irregularis]
MDNKNFNKPLISDVINNHVTRDDGIIRRRTYICYYSRVYESNSTKDTSTKKIGCPFLVNVSCPKLKNDENSVFINKINDQHNHPLNTSSIIFEKSQKFTPSMIDDIKFMTTSCKFGITAQRKFLEGKYPSHPIYSKDLYATIQSFRPTSKSLLNNAAIISNWLDEQKENYSCWVVARGWDNDNTLTHLLWMTPTQVENWIQYTDCILNDITHKINRYGMALSLFVGFDNNRHNILLAQALLADKNADPAVDAAVCQVFHSTYPIHCAYHISQNLHKNLKKSLSNNYEKFLEDFYRCRNNLSESGFEQLFDKLIQDYPMLNLTLNFYIEQRCTGMLDMQDKENEYNFWHMSIPIKKNPKTVNFLFTKVDECLQKFLTPTMLKMHQDEMNQSVYYIANLVDLESIEILDEVTIIYFFIIY